MGLTLKLKQQIDVTAEQQMSSDSDSVEMLKFKYSLTSCSIDFSLFSSVYESYTT